MNVDPSGNAWYNKVYDWVNTIVGFLNPISWLTFLGGILGAAIQGNWGKKMLLA